MKKIIYCLPGRSTNTMKNVKSSSTLNSELIPFQLEIKFLKEIIEQKYTTIHYQQEVIAMMNKSNLDIHNQNTSDSKLYADTTKENISKLEKTQFTTAI